MYPCSIGRGEHGENLIFVSLELGFRYVNCVRMANWMLMLFLSDISGELLVPSLLKNWLQNCFWLSASTELLIFYLFVPLILQLKYLFFAQQQFSFGGKIFKAPHHRVSMELNLDALSAASQVTRLWRWNVLQQKPPLEIKVFLQHIRCAASENPAVWWKDKL